MVTNKSSFRGWTSEGPVDGTVATHISGATTFPNTVSFQNTASFSVYPTFSTRYEAYQRTGSQSFSGDGVHSVVQIADGLSRVNNGLQLWNTSSYTLFPTVVGKVYFIRIDGILSSSTGNPYFHVDLEYAGGIPTGVASHHASASIHRQSVEVSVVRGVSYDHSHFHANFMIFSDTKMLVSGVQFYGAIDTAQTVTLKSASIMITEH
ncbi:MAG: hypothetical protein WC761_00290 [Candidatus Paceibacterota bacterium]|jgi:hypothetical protein